MSLPVVNNDAANQPPPTSFKKKGMKQSSKKRLEEFRLSKSRDAQALIHKEASDNTSMDLDSLLNCLQQLQVNKSKQVSEVPVTTRGIGFLVNECYDFATTRAPRAQAVCDTNQLYRYSLAQLQLQLSRSTEHSLVADPEFGADIQFQTLDCEFAHEIQSAPTNFGMVADSINAAGVVEHNQQQFAPFVPLIQEAGLHSDPVSSVGMKRKRVETVGFIPDPFTVTFNNLSDTVAAIANVDTPLVIRRYFIENNPIPGAVFENDVLTNRGVIMPENYGREHLRHDIRACQKLFGLVGSKMATQLGACTYSGFGSAAMLCGHYKEPMRLHQGVVHGPATQRVRSARPVEHASILRGLISLLGEYPVDGLCRNLRQFSSREPASAVEYIDIGWHAVTTCCLEKRRT